MKFPGRFVGAASAISVAASLIGCGGSPADGGAASSASTLSAHGYDMLCAGALVKVQMFEHALVGYHGAPNAPTLDTTDSTPQVLCPVMSGSGLGVIRVEQICSDTSSPACIKIIRYATN